jgi:anthranilate phosphoribosyltransferase/anthranilate synthase/phosphoribosyltransferase
MSNTDSLQTMSNSSSNTSLTSFLVRLMRGENLAFEEAQTFFLALLDENAKTEQIAGALVALANKGETAEELAGMASIIREKSLKIAVGKKNCIDIGGTGRAAFKTFNISTAASFIISGAGLSVPKHCNRAVSSKTGSADVLTELGVKVACEPNLAQATLNGAGICILFGPKFHRELRRVGEIRKNLGVRTSFNLLGLLSNPANPPRQIVGVSNQNQIEPMAKALQILGTEYAWVVHGIDGLDEITLTGETLVAEVTKEKIRKFTLKPEDFGVKRATIKHLHAKSPQESAKIIQDLLDRKRKDEARSLVLINAAAAIYVGGLAQTLPNALRLAENSLDSNSAGIKLERLIQITNK